VFRPLTSADVNFKAELKSEVLERRYPWGTPDPSQANNTRIAGTKQAFSTEPGAGADLIDYLPQPKHSKIPVYKPRPSTNNQQFIKLNITPPATPKEQSPEAQGPAKRRKICNRPPTRQIMRWNRSSHYRLHF